MTDIKPDPNRFEGHHVSDATDHARIVGHGTRGPLPAMPAPKRPMKRRIKVTQRAPFLPDHPQARHGLQHAPKAHR